LKKKYNFKIGKMIDIIGSFMFSAMVLLTMFNVASDWMFNRRYGEIQEFVLAAFVWVGYVGMGELYKSDEHISVDLLGKSLPEKANRILSIFIDLIVMIISVIIMYFAIVLTLKSSTKYTAVLKIPYIYIDLAVVIGFTSTVIYAIQNIVKNIRLLIVKKDGDIRTC